MPIDALFLDRDGVINLNRSDHVKTWDQFIFVAGALSALRRLRLAGIPIVVVTNQAVIGRGMVEREVVEDIHQRLRRAVEWAGGQVLDILYCPHAPEDNCDCRKPQPGLLIEAARRYGFDLSRCALVGDAVSDIQAGQSVGCATVMVRTGRGMEQLLKTAATSLNYFHLAADLSDAVDWLLTRHESIDFDDSPSPVFTLTHEGVVSDLHASG